MRNFIEIAKKQERTDKILLTIMSFGEGWEAEGVMIKHSGEGRPTHYVIPSDAVVTDDAAAELAQIDPDSEDYMEALIKHNILKPLDNSAPD